MSKPNWDSIAEQLNASLAEARMSSQDLAVKAGVDRKTVDRLRAGNPVRAQTLQWIEQALKMRFGAGQAGAENLAPASFGGYRHDSVAAYVGEYVAFRRSFDTAGRIIASYLAIAWDDERHALGFNESQDNRLASGKAYAYRFEGDVLIPPNLGVMNFVVRSKDGRVRLISTAMPREDGGTLYMKGFILTLNELLDIGYFPVTSPIFLARVGPTVALETGIVDSDDPRYRWADEILAGIAKKFGPQPSQRSSGQ